jgi:hypothetical protein
MPRKGVAKNRAPKDDKRFNAAAFYDALSSVVEARKIPWTHVSRETGVTTSTLSQMKVGRRPDAASLAALSAWAGLNPAHFVRRLQRGTPDLVRSISDVLRADQTLQPKAASALETIIRLVYDALTKRADDHAAVIDQISEKITRSRKKLRMPREAMLKEADFALWANENIWTVDQAAFLLLGFEPIVRGRIPFGRLPREYTILRRLLLRNAGVNLRFFGNNPGARPRFRSSDVLHWAESHSLLVPEKLKGQI